MGATQSTNHPHLLDTSLGKLNGIEQRDKSGNPICHRYLKVPYAQPPTGQRRWRRPQPLPEPFSFSDPSGAPGDYTNFGPICPQPYYPIDKVFVPNPDAAPPIVNVQSEDCLYLNVWVPARKPPRSGWPVQVHLHGGWLQVGHANQGNETDPFDLLRCSTSRIIVVPTYRLNLFGFLAGADLASLAEDHAPGNYGFWDQRAALEWTSKHITHFGGDASNITVGGLSAGAHSSFFQLYYDSHLPSHQRLIKRIYLWSNAIAIQPPSSDSSTLTSQFNEVCTANSIPTHLSPTEKLSRLRSVPSEQLVASIPKLSQHTFRASTDDSFIPSTFLSSLHCGAFTTLLANHNISILASEVRDEYKLYKLVNPPHDYDSLVVQLLNYYPKHIVDAILKSDLYKLPNPNANSSSTPSGASNTDIADTYATVFAHIVADVQIHASVRNLTSLLLEPPSSSSNTSSSTPLETEKVTPLPTTNFLRAIIHWSPRCMTHFLHQSMALCHGSDSPIWWYSGYRCGWTDADKKAVDEYLSVFGRFLHGQGFSAVDRKAVRGEGVGGVGGGEGDGDVDVAMVRMFRDDGGSEYERDPRWERGMDIARVVWEAQKHLVSGQGNAVGEVEKGTEKESKL